jgi:hypothetical protein
MILSHAPFEEAIPVQSERPSGSVAFVRLPRCPNVFLDSHLTGTERGKVVLSLD